MNRTYLIVIAAVIALLVVVGGGYYWYTGTPEYALKQIQKAYETHDTELAFTYIDFDSVFESIWLDIQKEMTKDTVTSDNEWEAFGAMIGQGIVQNMKPSLKERLRTEMIDAVRNIEEAEESDLSKLAATYSVRKEGKIAIVEGDSPLQFHLEKRTEHYWRVVAIKGWTAEMNAETTEQ